MKAKPKFRKNVVWTLPWVTHSSGEYICTAMEMRFSANWNWFESVVVSPHPAVKHSPVPASTWSSWSGRQTTEAPASTRFIGYSNCIRQKSQSSCSISFPIKYSKVVSFRSVEPMTMENSPDWPQHKELLDQGCKNNACLLLKRWLSEDCAGYYRLKRSLNIVGLISGLILKLNDAKRWK